MQHFYANSTTPPLQRCRRWLKTALISLHSVDGWQIEQSVVMRNRSETGNEKSTAYKHKQRPHGAEWWMKTRSHAQRPSPSITTHRIFVDGDDEGIKFLPLPSLHIRHRHFDCLATRPAFRAVRSFKVSRSGTLPLAKSRGQIWPDGGSQVNGVAAMLHVRAVHVLFIQVTRSQVMNETTSSCGCVHGHNWK